jgi:hypothetical protein
MKTNLLIAVISLMTLFTSCVKEIDLQLDSEMQSRLIVDGLITDNDSVQTVMLSMTSPYDSDKPCPPATGATVSVSDGASMFYFSETNPGIYQSSELKGKVGKTYTLTINYTGETYQATTTMHEGFPIDSIAVKKFPYGFPANLPHGEIFIWGQESPVPNQYYLFQYALNGKWNDSLITQGYYYDMLNNGKYLEEVSAGIFSTYDEDVTLRLRSISVDEQYFWFLDACIWNVMPNMFFSPPPANVKGNVSNGALGYFRACSVNYSETIHFKMKELK